MLTIGSGCFFQEYVYMRAGSEGYIRIGNDCAVNSFAKLFGHGGIEIGDRTQLGPACLITTTHHDYQREDLKAEFRKVTIGKGVWVGANTLILPGVTIGDDCVIGGGSVVTRDIAGGSIAVGSPARVIRSKAEGKGDPRGPRNPKRREGDDGTLRSDGEDRTVRYVLGGPKGYREGVSIPLLRFIAGTT